MITWKHTLSYTLSQAHWKRRLYKVYDCDLLKALQNLPNYVIISLHEHISEPTSLYHAHMFNIAVMFVSRKIKPLCNKRILLLPSYNTCFCVARPSNTEAFNKPLAHKLKGILQFRHQKRIFMTPEGLSEPKHCPPRSRKFRNIFQMLILKGRRGRKQQQHWPLIINILLG